MDFSSAIQAHANWRLRLFGYCKGVSKEQLDVRAIEKDNVCELGKWLYGEGKRFRSESVFPKLVEAHAAFHKAAAAIAELVHRGQQATAQQRLEASDSEFVVRSREVVKYLVSLRDKSAPGSSDQKPAPLAH